jgi:hypothetical protein
MQRANMAPGGLALGAEEVLGGIGERGYERKGESCSFTPRPCLRSVSAVRWQTSVRAGRTRRVSGSAARRSRPAARRPDTGERFSRAAKSACGASAPSGWAESGGADALRRNRTGRRRPTGRPRGSSRTPGPGWPPGGWPFSGCLGCAPRASMVKPPSPHSATVCRPGKASWAPKALGDALAIDAQENARTAVARPRTGCAGAPR